MFLYHRTIDRSNFKEIVHIGAVTRRESQKINLVAVTHTGIVLIVDALIIVKCWSQIKGGECCKVKIWDLIYISVWNDISVLFSIDFICKICKNIVIKKKFHFAFFIDVSQHSLFN